MSVHRLTYKNVEFINEYNGFIIILSIKNIMSDTKKRTFKIKFNGEESGRIKSNGGPRSAAAKALSSLKKNNPNYKAGKNNEFTLIETTRGGKHKEFNYTGKIVNLENPHEVTVGDKTIVYKHRCLVKRVNNKSESDDKSKAKSSKSKN